LPRIIITIEDTERGTVKVTSDPTFETMVSAIHSGQDTAAMAYAITCINAIRAKSKEAGEKSKLITSIPGLRV
jgi:hypothetical protein